MIDNDNLPLEMEMLHCTTVYLELWGENRVHLF